MPRSGSAPSLHGTSWRHQPAGFPSGATSGTSHDDLTTTTSRKTARRRREVAQILQRCPADNRLRQPHPVPRSNQLPLELRELQASVSPTPFVVDPGAAPATASQSCVLQICIRCGRTDVMSSTGSERTAPRRGYFFFFAATLRLAGAFFFAAVFAFVAFFTILPSWPKPSGGVASAPARIAGTAFRLLQRKEKNIFHIKETCIGRPRARARQGPIRLVPR